MPSANSIPPLVTFLPPVWLRNPHLQSTLPTLSLWRWPVWRRSQALRACATAQVFEGNEVRLSGYLSLQNDRQSRWVILLHGWLGDASSSYVLSLGAALYAQGYHVVRLNLRDHGGSEHLNPGVFHSCLLDDVLSVVRNLQQRYEMRDLSMAGFSLGGNFALRVAAKASTQGISLRQVAAICPAVDPYACDVALTNGLPIYAQYFLHKWKQSLRRKQQLFPDRYDFTPWLGCRSITDLTDGLVRRYVGFAGAREYYAGYSLLGETLQQLDVPSQILLSADDPIVPVSDAQRLPMRKSLQITQTQYGGHCGFITGWWPERWSDEWAVAALA